MAIEQEDLAGQSVRTERAFSRLTHQLNNPLATITLQLEVLNACAQKISGPSPLQQEMQEALDSVQRSLERLSKTLNESRLLFRAPHEVQTCEWQGALTQVIGQICEEQPAVRNRISVQAELATQAEKVSKNGVRADPFQLAWVTRALIENALEATAGQADGCVEVSLRFQDQGWRLEVRDNGPGLPEAVIAELYAPFVSGNRSQGKAGLGLAISQAVVKVHGGKISYDRNNDHRDGNASRATVFSVWWPEGGSLNECSESRLVQERIDH